MTNKPQVTWWMPSCGDGRRAREVSNPLGLTNVCNFWRGIGVDKATRTSLGLSTWTLQISSAPEDLQASSRVLEEAGDVGLTGSRVLACLPRYDSFSVGAESFLWTQVVVEPDIRTSLVALGIPRIVQ